MNKEQRTQHRIKELKLEIQRNANKAHKRIKRLQAKDYNTPALQKWVDGGSVRFGVKGKDYNQLVSELSRVKKFNEAKTSTIKGAEQVLKDMSTNIGLDKIPFDEIQAQSETFFRLAEKVEENLRMMDNSASAIGYQQIWNSINEYTDMNSVDLATTNPDDLVQLVTQLIQEQRKPSNITDADRKFKLFD